MSTPSYDVAVVGAGPAGSTAARMVAKYGLNTILLDSRKQVGVPIQCGEYLPIPNEMLDLLPNSPRIARLVDVPKAVITNRSTRLRLFSPFCNEFEFKLVSNVIDRAKFDQYLAQQAEDAGARIQLGTKVLTRTSTNSLVLQNKTGRRRISAKVVIGADGVQSRVAKSIGVQYTNRARDLSPCIQYVMAGVDCDPRTTEMYFGNQIAPGGYAWVIPKNESTVNIGLGFRKPFASTFSTAFSYLQHFISSHPSIAPRMKNGKVIRKTGAIVPAGGPMTKTYSDSVLLIGDAAGHVMASNGGGIPTALGGGEIAGLATVQHLGEGMPLSWYEETWKKEFGQELLTALDILRIADAVMTSDKLTDRCMRLAGPRYLQHLIRCRLPFPVKLASKTLVKVLKLLSS